MNIKEELTCKHCNEIYRNPIILNCCGKSICKHHVDELIANKTSNTFSCSLCNQENSNENFIIHELMVKLIKRELHEFKLDSKCEIIFKKLKLEIQNLDAILKDPENLIYEEISELKRQVDFDREKLKLHIDKLSDDIIQQLETYEQMFKSEYKSNIDLKHYNELVESSKEQLRQYEEFLNSFSSTKEQQDEKNNQNEMLTAKLRFKIKEATNKLFSCVSIKYKSTEFKLKEYIDKTFSKLEIRAS